MGKKIMELRAGRWPTALGLTWLQTKKVCSVLITGKQGAAAIVFGVFSLLISLILYFLSLGQAPFTKPELIAGGSVIVILSAIGGGIWALHIMSPSEYAHTTIGSSTASETLQLISMDVRRACRAFREDGLPFTKESQQSHTRHGRLLQRLKRRFAKKHATLLRITALLELGAQQLDIPLHRFRDLLLEYDPDAHRTFERKFIQNLELLHANAPLNDDHIAGISAENADIVQKAEARIRAQTDMLEYVALHPSILRMAAVHSTAQATQEYARAISWVANLTYEQTPPGVWDTDAASRLYDGMGGIRFLACRQRAHSGFDLNQTCLNMASIAIRRGKEGFDSQSWTALDKLGNSINREDGGPFIDNRKLTATECRDLRKTFGDLRKVWPCAVEHIQEDRRRIVERFRLMYLGWQKLYPKKKTLLVTHGFSTTVREVFKRALPSPGPNLPLEDIPDIFVIGSGDQADLDSRIMVSAIKGSAERCFRRIAAGDKNTLAKVVEDDMKVMVVLGAECFDRRGRVLHPWGLADVEFIKDKLGDPTAFSVVVVAEGYKFQEDLLANPQVFRYHLDRVQLYDPEWVDVIVTTDVEMQNCDRRSSHGQLPLSGNRRSGSERRTIQRDKHILRREVFFDPRTHQQVTSHEFKLTLN